MLGGRQIKRHSEEGREREREREREERPVPGRDESRQLRSGAGREREPRPRAEDEVQRRCEVKEELSVERRSGRFDIWPTVFKFPVPTSFPCMTVRPVA